MSHGSGGGSTSRVSCTSVALGKYVRRALRGASGRRRIKDKPRAGKKPRDPVDSVSVELVTSSAAAAAASSARRDSVVRVVLASGVVEVYAGVVLACTVIEKHPGLCLAHPDVFRNPHSARVRPLEPLFPGQKFYLLPQSTMEKLQRKIPESSVGAVAEEEEDGEEVTSTEEDQDHSGSSATSTEEEQGAAAGNDLGCCAREYYVAKDRWSECHFKKMVARGLAVEESTQPEKKKKKKKKKKKGKKGKRKDPAAAPAAWCRTFRVAATPRRTWEPSLPSVEEEISPTPVGDSEITSDDL